MEEFASLVPVECATVVSVILGPEVLDDGGQGTVTLRICAQAVRERVVVEEYRVIQQDLDVPREHLPSDRGLV